MKTFIFDRYKGMAALRLGEMPEPEVRDHDVLVAVHAASLNQLDAKIRDGEFKLILPYRLPLILGNDVAGIVVRVGSRVQGFQSGDQVYARPNQNRIGTFSDTSTANIDLVRSLGADCRNRLQERGFRAGLEKLRRRATAAAFGREELDHRDPMSGAVEAAFARRRFERARTQDDHCARRYHPIESIAHEASLPVTGAVNGRYAANAGVDATTRQSPPVRTAAR